MKRTCGLWMRAALLAGTAVLLLSGSAVLAQEKRFFSLHGRTIIGGEPPTLGASRRSAEQGDELWEQGDLDGAIAAYQESIRQAPIREAYVRLADALALKGRQNEAIKLYRDAYYPLPEPRKGLRGPGYEPGALLTFALLLSRANLHDEAITVFRVGVKETVGGTTVLDSLQFNAKQFDKPLFEAAVHLASGLSSGADDFAQAEFSEAIRIKPNFAEAYFYLGERLKQSSDSLKRGGRRVASYAAKREAHSALRRFLALKKQKGAANDKLSRDAQSLLDALEEK